jgi:hypothetical protein
MKINWKNTVASVGLFIIKYNRATEFYIKSQIQQKIETLINSGIKTIFIQIIIISVVSILSTALSYGAGAYLLKSTIILIYIYNIIYTIIKSRTIYKYIKGLSWDNKYKILKLSLTGIYISTFPLLLYIILYCSRFILLNT